MVAWTKDAMAPCWASFNFPAWHGSFFDSDRLDLSISWMLGESTTRVLVNE